MRYKALIAALLAVCLSVLTAACGDASMASDRPLTYEDIRNTGLANNCPDVDTVTRGSIALEAGKNYSIQALCLQPINYYVKEEGVSKRREAEFVEGRLLTRKTSSLDQIQGSLKVNSDGSLTFTEEDGFDFQPSTVLLPGGEEVPFLFTIKQLVATSQPGQAAITSSTDLKGKFRVPSYRGSTFLDPKGRGLASGYDNAVALPADADSDELAKENVKKYDIGTGNISLQVAKVDADTNEIAGTFVSYQPSDTDMGSKKASDMRIVGRFYARVESDA